MGGAYFLPWSPAVENDLKSLKLYVEGLHTYTEIFDKKGKTVKNPRVTVVSLNSGNSGFDTRLDIAQEAIAGFKNRLQVLSNTLMPVIGDNVTSGRTEKMSDKIRQAATVEFVKIQADIATYQSALDDKLNALNVYLESATQVIIAAQTMTDYKPPATRKA